MYAFGSSAKRVCTRAGAPQDRTGLELIYQDTTTLRIPLRFHETEQDFLLRLIAMEQILALGAGHSGVTAIAEGDALCFSPSPSIPQKRVFEEEHQPPVPSPLNSEFPKSKDDAPAARERAARAKKESFKKRESKGPALTEARSTPDPRSASKKKSMPSNQLPVRYMIPPRITDFVAPQAPTFTHHHTIEGPDGQKIEFQETSDQ